MRKLEDIPKKEFFTTPDDYFDALPGRIHARMDKGRKTLHRPVFSFTVRYAVPAMLIVAAGIFWLKPFNRGTSDVNTMLSAVETDDLIAFLDESDLSTDEVIESGDFSTTDVQDIEGTVYDLNITNDDIQNIVDDLD